MLMRLLVSLVTVLAAMILWPLAAHAGFCPNLPNCFGGDGPNVDACVAGVGVVAGLCTPQKHGGAWQDHSDDFGGDDIADDGDNLIDDDDDDDNAANASLGEGTTL